MTQDMAQAVIAYMHAQTPLRLQIGMAIIRDSWQTLALAPHERSALRQALDECDRLEAEARNA